MVTQLPTRLIVAIDVIARPKKKNKATQTQLEAADKRRLANERSQTHGACRGFRQSRKGFCRILRLIIGILLENGFFH